MHLTPAQETTLRNDIAANVNTIPAGFVWSGSYAGLAINTLPNGTDENIAIAGWYNLVTNPAFTVWKTSVTRNEVGKAFVATALDAITAGNNDKLANFAAWNDVVNPSRADQRQFFENVFSVAAGASTRAALLVLWKRIATNTEKLFATGTGTDAVPATLVVEGILSGTDVSDARNN